MMASSYVSRVNQIDAIQLDDEIESLLKTKAREVSKVFPPGKVDKWQPEIDAILEVLIWSFSLRIGKSTFGQQLLNLKYSNLDKRKAFLYLALTTLPKYLQKRLADSRYVTQTSTKEKVKFVIEWMENAVKLVGFLNLLLFLQKGSQPRIVERILRMHSHSRTTNKPRIIGYSYMTRELLWHSLMELFSITLPLINFHYIKQLIIKFCYKNRKIRGNVMLPKLTRDTNCAYCHETPILPSHAGCEHIFCYYCINANFTASRTFRCPVCNLELQAENLQHYIMPVE